MKHTVRHKNTTKNKTLLVVDNYTRGKAIALYCTECEGWEGNVRDCTVKNCPLFPFRRKTNRTISERPLDEYVACTGDL